MVRTYASIEQEEGEPVEYRLSLRQEQGVRFDCIVERRDMTAIYAQMGAALGVATQSSDEVAEKIREGASAAGVGEYAGALYERDE